MLQGQRVCFGKRCLQRYRIVVSMHKQQTHKCIERITRLSMQESRLHWYLHVVHVEGDSCIKKHNLLIEDGNGLEIQDDLNEVVKRTL